MDYVADSEVASVTILAVTSAAATGLEKESSDKYDIKDSRKHNPYFFSTQKDV